MKQLKRVAINHRNHVSPASNGGCGLKLAVIKVPEAMREVSPASNGGCGLKQGGGVWLLVGVDGFTRQ